MSLGEIAEVLMGPRVTVPFPCWLACREPAEAMEIRVRLTAEDVRAEGEKVTAEFKKWLDAGT